MREANLYEVLHKSKPAESKRVPRTLRDLKLKHSNPKPIHQEYAGYEESAHESDGDAWCRKMREGDQHMEELRIDSKFDD